MLKIGLTGGIGSGKTTVAKVFEKLGVPVFYSDQEAKKCMQFNVALKEKYNLFLVSIYMWMAFFKKSN